MSKLKDATMIDATEERKNRFNGETVLLTPYEAKIHDDIFINEDRGNAYRGQGDWYRWTL